MARKIRSKAIYYGRNNDLETDEYVRCARCGFPCKPERDISYPDGSHAGWGIRYDAIGTAAVGGDLLAEEGGYILLEGGERITLEGEDPATGYSSYDPVVTGGCPQCGTFRYNK